MHTSAVRRKQTSVLRKRRAKENFTHIFDSHNKKSIYIQNKVELVGPWKEIRKATGEFISGFWVFAFAFIQTHAWEGGKKIIGTDCNLKFSKR